MSYPNLPPAYRRYLEGPSELVKQPVFWASTIGLLLVLLGAWKYWNDPEWFNAFLGNPSAKSEKSVKPTANPNLSPENSAAIGANPNSPSTTGAGVDRSSSLPPLNLPNQKAQLPSSPGSLPLSTAQANALSSQKQNNLPMLGTFSQRLNGSSPSLYTSPVTGSRGLTKSSSSGINSSLLTARATSNPSLSSNSLSSRNTSRVTPSVNSLPNASNRLAVPYFPSRANETQMPVSIQPQTLPTLISPRQLPSLPTSVPGATGDMAAQGRLSGPSATLPSAAGNNASRGEIPVLPATVSGATNNNTYLERLYPSATGSGATDNNASPTPSAGSLNTSTPSPSPSQASVALGMTPTAPVKLTEFRQYSTQMASQTNGVSVPGFEAMLEKSGLQPSQTSLPSFTAPPAVPGSEIWSQANNISK
ncbi:MAG TPA: hypothetical protein V6D14_12835 [Coleofasciculaceae cyanobacterium]